VGTFLLGDPAGKTPRGVATGTPLVNGANQAGKQLVTDGWTINIANILRAGDYIQVATGATQRLYKNLTDANSNPSGQATFDIFPTLHEPPADNASIVTASAKGLFRLASNDTEWSVDAAQLYGVAFEAIEAI
jgi:hypothetical protein